MMKNYVTGLQHIGIPTNDIKKSLEFYEKLGFTRLPNDGCGAGMRKGITASE